MTITRRRKALTCLAAAAATITALAVPAEAGPPIRGETVGFAYGDFDNGYVVLINTDRETYCTDEALGAEQAFLDWILGGEQGDPPPPPQYGPGLDPIATVVPTGNDTAVGRAKSDNAYVEIWPFGPDAVGVGPCLDSAGAERFATGTARYRANNNDITESDTRALAVSERGRAIVEDTAGRHYRYEWRFHANSRCAAPPMAPPRCLTSTATLTPLWADRP
jgi:hypothetical protein